MENRNTIYKPHKDILTAFVVVLGLVVSFVLTACSGIQQKSQHEADSLWYSAYRLRYTDVDSATNLLRQSLSASHGYREGRARGMALNAYLRYQHMDYDGALAYCDSTYQFTDNQITLLMADVMRMKVYQRICDGGNFYKSRNMASRRLLRVDEELDEVKGIDARCYTYAQSEYHIISSTYYYYLEQDSLAKLEMHSIDVDQLQHRDTTQWLYYEYMMGSGGLVDGDEDNVALTEFGYLSDCYFLARRADIPYFEANALQALSTRLKTSYDRQLISQKYPEDMEWLMTQHLSWMTANTNPSDSLLPMALAHHALQCFVDYGDSFQTACVYRTMGELSFYSGHFYEALGDYGYALSFVNGHHHTYYPTSKGTLSLYNQNDHDTIPTECHWIADKNVKTVPDWMAAIRQQISLTYAALNMMPESEYNRHIYLAILASTTQDKEMQSRMQELRSENVIQFSLLLMAAFLLLLVIILIVSIVLRLRRHDFALSSGKKRTLLRDDKLHVQQLMDELEESKEACEMSRLHIIQNKNNNAEKRAKVSLVQAIMPFLDRIISEVNRMSKQAKPEPSQLEYVIELADRIVQYNEILTEWIKMQQGQLRLQISTIALQPIFDIVAKGHFTYDQQGVTLNVVPTEAKVKADEALTLFMINTLSDNARKFTPRGGCVTIQASETDKFVEVSVTDTGCGMKQEDIDTILGNKIYDASKIGVNSLPATSIGEALHDVQGKKGFGFGLMNCKGIIEKYRKTSSLFSVCYFGIESKVGEGSRFFFRLPRVLMAIFAFVASISCISAKSAMVSSSKNGVNVSVHESSNNNQPIDTFEIAKRYYQKALQCNKDSAYEEALHLCDSALYIIDPQLVIFNADNTSGSQSAEFEALRHNRNWDYHLLVGLRNQIAISALALHDWALYTYNNNICTHLHHYTTLDPHLPTYCDDLSASEVATRQLTALLVVLSLLSLILIYMLLRGKRKVARRMADELQEKIDAQNDVLDHFRYEEDRLYVRNQVLDNCLSTIKHESMYYPSRIRQLTERMKENPQADDLQQLRELTSYYKEMYTLLSSQAENQTLLTGLKRENTLLSDLFQDIQQIFTTQAHKLHHSATLQHNSEGVVASTLVKGDSMLLHELFHQLFLYLLTKYPNMESCKLCITKKNNLLQCTVSSSAIHHSEQEAHDLFYPQMDNIPLLIVKQIIRDFDALMGNPGLRLVAEEQSIWFNLPIA